MISAVEICETQGVFLCLFVLVFSCILKVTIIYRAKFLVINAYDFNIEKFIFVPTRVSRGLDKKRHASCTHLCNQQRTGHGCFLRVGL